MTHVLDRPKIAFLLGSAAAALAPAAAFGADPIATGTEVALATPIAAVSAPATESETLAASSRPPPLNVEYAQYGVAIAAEMNIDPGAACPEPSAATEIIPCILGSGGGLVLRGGYRSAGPWYLGGAYEFVKMDSGNLYRLGIFQQIRAEMRYLPDFGYRASPYVSWGLGAIAYGNEWGVETGGALAFGGAGVEVEVSRSAVVGVGLVYRPTLIAGWTDTAGHIRDTALAQFLSLELVLEVRSEVGRQ